MILGSHRIATGVLAVWGVAIGCCGAVWGDTYSPGSAPTCNISCSKTTLYSNEQATCSISDWTDTDILINGEGARSNVSDSMGTVTWSASPNIVTFSSQHGNPVTITAGSPNADTVVTIQAVVQDSGSHPGAIESVTKTVQVTVKATKIADIERKDGGATWISATGAPIHVAKGTTLTFRAIPDPSTASWPPGKPVWGGAATGTGPGPVNVTFNTVGTTTVTATCINTKTATIVVGTFAGKLVPNDNFTGRSLTRVGVEEMGILDVVLGAGTNLSDLVPLTWSRTAGTTITLGTVNPDAGTANFVAGDEAGPTTFTLTDKNGNTATLTVTVVLPTGTRMTRVNPNTVWHRQGYASAGILLHYWLDPKDVSFKYVTFGEGTCPAKNAKGCYVSGPPGDHPECYFGEILGGNITTGCRVSLEDRVWTSYQYWENGGSFTWNIPTRWFDALGDPHTFGGTKNQTMTIEPNGRTTAAKDGQSGSADVSDPESGY